MFIQNILFPYYVILGLGIITVILLLKISDCHPERRRSPRRASTKSSVSGSTISSKNSVLHWVGYT